MKRLGRLIAGLVLAVPLVLFTASTASADPIHYCDPTDLQLNQHQLAEGHKICFGTNDCGVINLGYYSFHGIPWNDQVSSIFNRTARTAWFYNYKGHGDPNNLANSNLVIAVNSGHYLRNLALDSSADGGNANDKIDIVWMCW